MRTPAQQEGEIVGETVELRGGKCNTPLLTRLTEAFLIVQLHDRHAARGPAVCCARHTRVPPSVAVPVRTVPSSCPACARAAQSGWPRAAACHPTPDLPGSARLRPACGRPHCQPPGAGVGLRPVASTTPEVHSLWDCGTIAFEISIRKGCWIEARCILCG